MEGRSYDGTTRSSIEGRSDTGGRAGAVSFVGHDAVNYVYKASTKGYTSSSTEGVSLMAPTSWLLHHPGDASHQAEPSSTPIPQEYAFVTNCVCTLLGVSERI